MIFSAQAFKLNVTALLNFSIYGVTSPLIRFIYLQLWIRLSVSWGLMISRCQFFCLKKAIAQAILGAMGGIVWNFMVIHSSKAVSNYVQMVGISALCLFLFFLAIIFFLPPYVAEWIYSLSAYSLSYRNDLHNDLMRSLFGEWANTHLFFIVPACSCSGFAEHREIHGIFLKVHEWWKHVFCGTINGDWWSEY